MAFKQITSGLADKNDVIDEIVTFCTTDLAQPWTLEYNLDASNISTSPSDLSVPDRRTCLSIVPAGQNVARAFDDSRFPFIPSPLPTRIYVRIKSFEFSTIYDGIQFVCNGHDPAGFAGSPQPAVNQYRTGGATVTTSPPLFYNDLNMDLGNSAWPTMELYNQDRGPYTSLTLFGPNQESPQNPNIPNYVYGVLEISPGVYTHFAFGEFKRFVPIDGGWGAFGHGYDDISDPINGSSLVMFTDANGGSSQGGQCSIAANVGQVQNAGGDWSLSPEPTTKWFGKEKRGLGIWQSTLSNNFRHHFEMWGASCYNNWLRQASVSLISGFVPLASPICNLCDEQTTGGANPSGDEDAIVMPTCYPEDLFLGDIDTFEPGVEVTIGGIPVVPFPFISKLASTPNSDYGGVFYRKRV